MILALLLPALAADAELDANVAAVLLERIGTARTLMLYDMAAWVTSDAVMADPEAASQLGRAWFVIQDGETPVGVYGRYDASTDSFFHVRSYRFDPEAGATTRVEADPPAEIALPRARAIDRVWAVGPPAPMKRLMKVGVNPNQYVLAGPGGLDVWLLPSLAQDGRLVTATCAQYSFDATGKKLTRARVERRKALVFSQGESELAHIVSVERSVPSVCELYWAFYYADDFKEISISTRELNVRFTDTEAGRIPVVTALK